MTDAAQPKSRAAIAAAAMALSQIPWIGTAIFQFGTEEAPLAAWHLFAAICVLTLAAGVWKRIPMAYGPASTVCYYVVAMSAYWAYARSTPVLWSSAGLAVGAAALVTLARGSLPGAQPAAPSSEVQDSFPGWLKENVEAIVIAFVMALVIRCFCIEVFKIPSSSMEPTLLGDITENHPRNNCTFGTYHVAQGGDRIMVTKYYYAFAPVERFDVVVFKFPLNQAKNFIKRVVGLPDETLKVWRGNLYVKQKGETQFKITRRTLRTQDSIWIDPARDANGFLSDPEEFRSHWSRGSDPTDFEVRAGELSTREAGGKRDIIFSFTPEITDGDGQAVNDLRLALDIELTSPEGRAFAEVVNEHGRFALVLDTKGASQLLRYAPGSGENAQPVEFFDLKEVRFAPYRRTRVDLSVFDGMAYARVDGEVKAKITFIETQEELPSPPSDARHTLRFGARGATFKTRNLSVGRDIYYHADGRHRFKDGQEIYIKPDHYVMMGDNVANSHDSRAWIERTYTFKNGRPPVVCEAQEVNKSDALREAIGKKLGLSVLPDYAIEGDQYGNTVAFNADELLGKPVDEEFFRVHRNFIVGKALWIWWPRGRWFHLIR